MEGEGKEYYYVMLRNKGVQRNKKAEMKQAEKFPNIFVYMFVRVGVVCACIKKKKQFTRAKLTGGLFTDIAAARE